MKDNELIAGHFSLCLQIFIASLLNAELTTDVARDAGRGEKSTDVRTGSRKDKRPALKSAR